MQAVERKLAVRVGAGNCARASVGVGVGVGNADGVIIMMGSKVGTAANLTQRHQKASLRVQ